jgi:hypothetical protein
MAEQHDTEAQEPQFIALGTQRTQIAEASRLHWFHWIELALSLVVTIGATVVTKSRARLQPSGWWWLRFAPWAVVRRAWKQILRRPEKPSLVHVAAHEDRRANSLQH